MDIAHLGNVFTGAMFITQVPTSSIRTRGTSASMLIDRMGDEHRLRDSDGWSSGVVVGVGALDARDDLSVDDADALSAGELERIGGDAIEVAQVPAAGLVHERERVGGEDLSVCTGALHAVRDVFGGV